LARQSSGSITLTGRQVSVALEDTAVAPLADLVTTAARALVAQGGYTM
jgi:hypothetical protein